MSFLINPYSFAGIDVTISTTAVEPVEGVFVLTIVFDEAVTSGFIESDINLGGNATAEDLHTEDNITWQCNIFPNFLGDISIFIPAGSVTPNNAQSNTLNVTVQVDLALLSNPAQTDVYYDFRELAGDNAAVILTDDPGRRDLSNNGRTLALINSPTMTNLLAAADVAIDNMALRTTGMQSGSTDDDGSTYLNRSFSVLTRVRSSDGRSTASWFVCGNFDGTDYGLRIAIQGSDSGAGQAGKIQLRYQGSVWVSTSQVFPDNGTGLHYLLISYDFETDTLTVKYDGSDVAGSFTTGSMAGLDPTAYACSANLYVGNHNNNGTAATLANTNQVEYFTIHPLLTPSEATSLTTYLNARKASFEVVDISAHADNKFPHDVIFSLFHPGRFYGSGKGDDNSDSVDGSFVVGEIDADGQITILGRYVNHGDQVDGETVLEISEDYVIHFVSGNALLMNVSNPAVITKSRTVAHGAGVVNGAIIMGDRYIIGANKGGYLERFDAGVNLANITTFTLVDSYDTTTDLGGDGLHDITAIDSEYVFVVNRANTLPTYHAAIYKVMNAGSLIALGSLTYTARMNDSSLEHANRCRLVPGTSTITISANPNFATVDVSTLASPFVADTRDMGGFCSGICFYRNRWAIPTQQVGIYLIDVVNNAVVILDAGKYDDISHATGNASWHDVDIYEGFGVPYIIVAAQSDSKFICVRINRW